MVSRLKTYWAAPVFEDTEKTRIACLLNITLIAISAVAFALTLADGLIGVADVRVLLVGLITALLPLVLRFVMKRGHVRFASLLLSSLFLVNVTLAVYFAGTIRSPLSTIYIVGIVIAGLMVSYRAAIVFTVLSALALLGLLQAETAGLLNPISVTVGLAQWFAYVATFIVVTVLVGLTISSINEAFERARRNETALSRTVTELQVTTERLRQAEAKYRTLVEHVPAITYIDVPDEKVACGYRSVYVSPQIEDILGYTADEFRADADLWPQLMHPDDRETALTRDARHFETGLPMRQEYRVFARSGRLVWLRDAAVAVRDEAGNIQFSQGIQFDITERKQAEETLQHSEARYRAVIEQSKDCIFLVDVDSKSITEANPAMQRLLGY
ncbi:MAG: PAS domain S-box protein, partial [Anaerolineae bacterium]|nr:PAS domain S-box protein [Anaerolineae bacterium]